MEISAPSDKVATSGVMELLGKTAVVTGASSGIGQAIAIELAAAGANVVVHARQNQAGASHTSAQIRALGREAKELFADLADPSTHEPFVEAAWQWRGVVNIWVNNAGVDVLTGNNAKLSFEEKLALLWPVDVSATLRLSRLVGERMRRLAPFEDGGLTPFAKSSEQKGSVPFAPPHRGLAPFVESSEQKGPVPLAPDLPVILNMGWDQAEQGMAGDSGEMFAATKGAVMAFTRSLAQSLAPHVRVNCLAPGWIKTAWGDSASADWQSRAVHESLLQRWGTPQDVARAARFLASPAAGFITGHILPINGGWRRE